MIFARLVVSAVFAVVLVNGAHLPEADKFTLENGLKLLDAVREILKFAIQAKKLPGFSNVENDAIDCVTKIMKGSAESESESECKNVGMKPFYTLFKKGYEPWAIPQIDPLTIADFETTLPSAILKLENVELSGFDTLKINPAPDSEDDFSFDGPNTAYFTVDLTVKGYMRLKFLVTNTTYEAHLVKTYPGVKIVVQDSCQKVAWRVEECNKNYTINHTFNGAPELTSGYEFINEVTYQEWYNENVNTVKKHEDEVLKKYVKEFVDAIYLVFFKIQEKFQSSVDTEKIDYAFSFIIDVLKQFESDIKRLSTLLV